MAKTHGRSTIPLPPSLVAGLETLGYRQMDKELAGLPIWRNHRHPDLYVQVITSNIPGSEHVVADWHGTPPSRISIDSLIAKLTAQLARLDNTNTFRSTE